MEKEDLRKRESSIKEIVKGTLRKSGYNPHYKDGINEIAINLRKNVKEELSKIENLFYEIPKKKKHPTEKEDLTRVFLV